MHRLILIFFMANTLIKLIIRVEEFVFRYVCRVRVRKTKIIEVND